MRPWEVYQLREQEARRVARSRPVARPPLQETQRRIEGQQLFECGRCGHEWWAWPWRYQYGDQEYCAACHAQICCCHICHRRIKALDGCCREPKICEDTPLCRLYLENKRFLRVAEQCMTQAWIAVRRAHEWSLIRSWVTYRGMGAVGRTTAHVFADADRWRRECRSLEIDHHAVADRIAYFEEVTVEG